MTEREGGREAGRERKVERRQREKDKLCARVYEREENESKI